MTTEQAVPLHVLVVDDDQVDRRATRRALARCGLPVMVDEEVDPARAADRVRSGSYHCVFLDYRFPRGNAFDLFADLLAEPCSQRPGIVLLTGMGDERIAAQSIQRGAQEYLSKDELGPETVRRAVLSACEKTAREREAARRDDQLVQMSFYDPLTLLPNRRLFSERLGQAVRDGARAGRAFAVLMMDLDGFKAVNDTLGHEAGDELLRRVGERLRGVVRESDTIARLGGDEFAAVLSTADSLEGALAVAERIGFAVEEPYAIGEETVHVGISIGVALYPAHGDAVVPLLHHADLAMYAGKSAGRRVTVHHSLDPDAGYEGAMIAQGLKSAIAGEGLLIEYQPQIRLDDGVPVGAEALARWQHPELGRLPPASFIPVAERCALIEPLTLRLLEIALAQSRCWREEGLDLRLAVNLSARVLELERLVDEVDARLRAAGVPHRRLCLEVTESGLMRSPERAERTVRGLAELGVDVSIDDFGTGPSSLRHLRDLPVSEVKVDTCLVAGMTSSARDRMMVESIVALGNAFGVRVVAEGIESDDVLRHLRDLRCRYGQGYRIGMPMGAAELERWCRAGSGAPGELPLSCVAGG